MMKPHNNRLRLARSEMITDRISGEGKPGPVAIHCKSCDSMRELADGVVALTVTSPPYWNAVDYKLHAQDPSCNYRERTYSGGYSDYYSYLAWLQRIFVGEVWRVTKPGGFATIVVGTVLVDGRQYSIPSDLLTRLMDGGWEFRDKIIWNKCCAGVKRARVAIQHPYPGYFYPNLMTEEILVLRKPGAPIYSTKSNEQKQAARFAIDEVFTRDTANNTWNIAPVPPGHLGHPCPFPEEIPYRLIQLYSYPDDLILDCFAGSGQTGKVARALNRRFVGYEIVPEYATLAERRSTEPLHLRDNQLVARFEKITLGEIA